MCETEQDFSNALAVLDRELKDYEGTFDDYGTTRLQSARLATEYEAHLLLRKGLTLLMASRPELFPTLN